MGGSRRAPRPRPFREYGARALSVATGRPWVTGGVFVLGAVCGAALAAC